MNVIRLISRAGVWVGLSCGALIACSDGDATWLDVPESTRPTPPPIVEVPVPTPDPALLPPGKVPDSPVQVKVPDPVGPVVPVPVPGSLNMPARLSNELGGFAAAVGVFAILPVGINIALYALEVLVAVLQAYVFAILTCLYLRDALHLH